MQNNIHTDIYLIYLFSVVTHKSKPVCKLCNVNGPSQQLQYWSYCNLPVCIKSSIKALLGCSVSLLFKQWLHFYSKRYPQQWGTMYLWHWPSALSWPGDKCCEALDPMVRATTQKIHPLENLSYLVSEIACRVSYYEWSFSCFHSSLLWMSKSCPSFSPNAFWKAATERKFQVVPTPFYVNRILNCERTRTLGKKKKTL